MMGFQFCLNLLGLRRCGHEGMGGGLPLDRLALGNPRDSLVSAQSAWASSRHHLAIIWALVWP
jgi:hypothetical protein